MSNDIIAIIAGVLVPLIIGVFLLIGRERKPSNGQPGRGGGTGGDGDIKEV